MQKAVQSTGNDFGKEGSMLRVCANSGYFVLTDNVHRCILPRFILLQLAVRHFLRNGGINGMA